MQKSEEIRSEHLWLEFRDLPRPRRDAKPWNLDDCPKSILVLLKTDFLLPDNWFPAMVWQFGCIDCAGWNCQWGPSPIGRGPPGADTRTYTGADTQHTYIQWNNPQKLIASIRGTYLWRSDKIVRGTGKDMKNFLHHNFLFGMMSNKLADSVKSKFGQQSSNSRYGLLLW